MTKQTNDYQRQTKCAILKKIIEISALNNP